MASPIIDADQARAHLSNTIRNWTHLPVAENRGLACPLLPITAMLAVSKERENGQDESFFNVSRCTFDASR